MCLSNPRQAALDEMKRQRVRSALILLLGGRYSGFYRLPNAEQIAIAGLSGWLWPRYYNTLPI